MKNKEMKSLKWKKTGYKENGSDSARKWKTTPLKKKIKNKEITPRVGGQERFWDEGGEKVSQMW